MSPHPLHVVIGPGPVGLAIAEILLMQGKPVRLVSRSGRSGGLRGVQTHAADVMQPDQAMAAFAGATTVYQCAAPAYQDWVDQFPALQENVLQAAARAGAVLVAAENLYGYGVAGTLTEDLPLTATTRKGRTRAQMSNRLFAAHRAGEVRTVTGRAADFFGPGVRVSAFGERLWPALIRGRPVNWFGDPDLPHSATYVPDFARALVRLGAEPSAWGRAWHVPSPPPLTPRQMMTRAATLMGLPNPKIRLTPGLMLRGIGLFLPAAGEIVEMGYSYTAPFIIDDRAYLARFGDPATDWDTALRATLTD